MPTFPISEWIKLLGEFFNQHGYLTVFLGTLGENTAFLGLFLPGNTLALLGAMYARLGTLNLGWVICLATLGTVLGYHIDYLFGRFILVHVVTRWSTSRLGRRMRLAGRLRLACRLLTKYGGRAILISHFVGHLRSFVALSAGVSKMNYRRFLGYELLAASLWNTGFCLLGYFLAAEADRIQTLFGSMSGIIIALLALIFLAWYIFRQRMKQHISRHSRVARERAKNIILRTIIL
jgi:membrane protein DedA with SNARE-associated domain